ncbi:MAG: fasciclin domain-containing protein [Prevotella sp.]|nr:fasciclin domain-containing protein [Prevotella sp.]
MKQRQIVRQGRRVTLLACGLLMGAWSLQSCKDDDILLTGQPSWLGNSIYERLSEDGNYKTVLQLVDDLGQHEVLSHTGSKTLFVASDSAFQEWFKDNSWGVKSYAQLSESQKKLLLNSSMINNAYLVELLSNSSGNPPLEGMSMRRETAISVYDSVDIVTPDMMPRTKAWKKFKDAGKSIPMLKDATSAPMIHFLPAFMKMYNITNSDLEILTNHKANDIKEAWVNGIKIVERDITCKNGYIQKVNGVIEPTTNMAEIIRRDSRMSKWSELLDRFSAPYYSAADTKVYNREYNNEDSVYVLRYFSSWSAGNAPNATDPDREAADALLRFDPGWNQYMYQNSMDYDLHYDAGAMLVPTNEALETWWNNEGRDLQQEYKVWDSIPASTLALLINVNMLPTLTDAVPSKFDHVLDDAKEPLGVKPSNVIASYMGCNGVVYLVDKVFTPTKFKSVVYPAEVYSKTMNIINWAIDQLNFLPFLLSMDNTYSMILPTNDAMMWYIDPAGYGNTDRNGVENPSIIEFWYDDTKGASERVQARRWSSTIDENGNITKGTRLEAQVKREVINDRLKRLLDQLIIIGDVEDGHEYYKSKGGTLVRVQRTSDGRLAFIGGWQMEHNNKQLPVEEDGRFPKSNGVAYQLNGQMPLGAQNSVYTTLKAHPEFSEFLELLSYDKTGLLANKLSSFDGGTYDAGLKAQSSKNLSVLDNYNYTVYVPTNASIRKLVDDGLLPTWDDYEAQTSEVWGSEALADSAQKVIKNIIVNFLRYHIQDHSVAVNMAPESYDEENGVLTPVYTNAYESMKRNPETGRYYPIVVDYSNNQMTVKDVLAQENPNDVSLQRHVVKTEGLYNLPCLEYWFDGIVGNDYYSSTIFMSSDAMVHQIDGPLLYEKMTPWREQLYNIRRY